MALPFPIWRGRFLRIQEDFDGDLPQVIYGDTNSVMMTNRSVLNDTLCMNINCMKTGTSMMRCSACKNTFYCSVACQKTDWKRGRHKFKCARSKNFFANTDSKKETGQPSSPVLKTRPPIDVKLRNFKPKPQFPLPAEKVSSFFKKEELDIHFINKTDQ